MPDPPVSRIGRREGGCSGRRRIEEEEEGKRRGKREREREDGRARSARNLFLRVSDAGTI